jgi:hypothetical protein
MDTVLVIVTGVSLALAAGMGMVLARTMREERERSDARVQLLEELATGGLGGSNRQRQEPEYSAATRPAQAEVVRYTDTLAAPLPSAAPRRVSTPSKPRRVVADLPLREAPPEEISGVQDLFRETHEPSPWPRRVAFAGGIAALVSLTMFGWTQLRTPESLPASSVADPGPASAATALELLSLRHTRDGNTLTVTGLVQNPKGGSLLSNVQATLFVFGANGTFLTSGRAALDYTSLVPGDESPFVIRVPVSGDVARYRVGFRGRDDQVLAHVDRRTNQVGRTF